MNTVIKFLMSFFVKQGIEEITKELTNTVAKLQQHSDTKAAEIDSIQQSIADKVADHQAELAELAYKASEARAETQRAAEIAARIGSLLK